MKRLCLCILAVVFILGLFSIGLNAQEEEAFDQAAGDAIVFIVHGVPGLDIGEVATYPVDIYVNGIKKLSDVKYGQIKLTKITPGTARIDIHKVGMGPEAGYPPVSSGEFTFRQYENASVVGYLHPDGEPRFVKFLNDFSPAGDPSKCRVIVHNISGEAKLGLWIYNNKPQIDYHPYMGTDMIDTGDKIVLEIAKNSLVETESYVWWLEVGAGWEKYKLVYDKPFKITAGKAIVVYIMGSLSSKTFKVVKKLAPLK